jgi:hypothetical protein
MDSDNKALLKTYPVSAPLPPRSYPLAQRARGVRRIAPERRGGPVASDCFILSVRRAPVKDSGSPAPCHDPRSAAKGAGGYLAFTKVS